MCVLHVFRAVYESSQLCGVGCECEHGFLRAFSVCVLESVCFQGLECESVYLTQSWLRSHWTQVEIFSNITHTHTHTHTHTQEFTANLQIRQCYMSTVKKLPTLTLLSCFTTVLPVFGRQNLKLVALHSVLHHK